MNLLIEFINDCGEAFVGSAGLMVIQSSVLIAILFGLDFVLRKRLRAVFRYWLWMLVLVKLTLPSSLAAPYSLGYWLADTVDRVERSLLSPANPSGASIDGVGYSWLEPVDAAIDDFTVPLLSVAAERSALPARDVSESTFFLEGPATDGPVGSYAVQPAPAANLMEVLPLPQADSTRDPVVALKWQAVLFGLWLVVCIGTGLLVLQKTLLARRLVRQADPPDKRLAELFESCIKRMRIGRDVGFGVSPVIPTPAVCGLFRPVVLIPERMSSHRLGTDELEAIFIHELAHIQRDDLWVKLLQTILQVVYFYNPLIWLANATIRRVREQAVDETVLVTLGEPAREVYPRALLKVAGWVFDRPAPGLRLIGVIESKGLLTERIKIMLDRPIPRSKRIGVIGLVSLFILGVFLLPMARADKRSGVEASEAVFGTDISVAGLEADNLEVLLAEPIDTGRSRVARGTPSLGIPIVDELFKSRSEIQKAQAVIAKDMAEIEAIKLQIKSLQEQIQMKLDMLHQKEAELKRMQPDLDEASGKTKQPIRPRRRTGRGSFPAQPLYRPPSGGMMGGGMMMGADTVPNAAPPLNRQSRGGGGMMGGGMMMGADTIPEAAPPLNRQSRGIGGMGGGMMMGAIGRSENSSNEVRKELQRILPGLLREMLPRLLAEAMTKAAGNNEPVQESMTEPMMWRRMVPPRMAPPRTGALTIPPPRMPAPRVKTRPDDTVDGFF